MELVAAADLVIFKAIFLCLLLYPAILVKSRYTKKPVQPLFPEGKPARRNRHTTPVLPPTRSIQKKLSQAGRRCLVFYGTQTGTAEKLALAFAREAKMRYGMECIVADLDDYDYGDLEQMKKAQALVFVLATYGEGEPTDNALGLEKYLRQERSSFAMKDLCFAVFGLGSTSYARFNRMAKDVDALLCSAGAQRLCDTGLGDDGAGTLEDDFLGWRSRAIPSIASHLGFQERPSRFQPNFLVEDLPADMDGAKPIFNGEPNMAHVLGRARGPYTSRNPYLAPLQRCTQLCSPTSDRSCLHLEFDISQCTMTYNTGDHVAIQPCNPTAEVDRFLRTFGLEEKRNVAFAASSIDSALPAPSFLPATYGAVAAHYLDISGPVPRQMLSVIADFASNSVAKDQISTLAADPERFRKDVRNEQLTLAQLLEEHTVGNAWHNVPFALLLEYLPTLKPRFYSISSASLVSRNTISVAAMADVKMNDAGDVMFTGVSSAYLSALGEKSVDATTHNIIRSTSRGGEAGAYLYVRRSDFRLPTDSSIPIIMIGPGTGVAPFRAFVQQRALKSKQGHVVGKTLLYSGFRNKENDLLYKDEWEVRRSLRNCFCHEQRTDSVEDIAKELPSRDPVDTDGVLATAWPGEAVRPRFVEG